MTLNIDIPDPRELAGSYDEQGPGALAELSEFYRKLGFDAGYSKAVRDQLEYSVLIAEQVLREQQFTGAQQDPRRLLYAFIARVDRRLSLFADPTISQSNEGYMEGGLGI